MPNYNFPSNLKYTRHHIWVFVKDDIAEIGITEYLGDSQPPLKVIFIEFPEVGAVVEAGDEMGSIESETIVAEIYSPVSGTVVEINQDASDDCDIVNDAPYGNGWLVRIRLSANADLSGLMDSEYYKMYVVDSNN